MNRKDYASLGERLKDICESWSAPESEKGAEWDWKVRMIFCDSIQQHVVGSAVGLFRNKWSYNASQANEMGTDVVSCMMLEVHKKRFEQSDGRGIGAITPQEYQDTFWNYYFWTSVLNTKRDTVRELGKMRRETEAGAVAEQLKDIRSEKDEWATRTRKAVKLCAEILLDPVMSLVVNRKLDGVKSRVIAKEVGVSESYLSTHLKEAWNVIHDCVKRRRDED